MHFANKTTYSVALYSTSCLKASQSSSIAPQLNDIKVRAELEKIEQITRKEILTYEKAAVLHKILSA